MSKTRAELKGFFKKNSVPTQSNFEDFIDSGLNQIDDGVSKLPDDPLTIQAAGREESLLRFTAPASAGGTARWLVTQTPAGAAGDGLAFADATGNVRLFLQSGTGNVGIGTLDPGNYKLNVNGSGFLTGLNVNGNAAVTGSLSGPARDYQCAQFTLSGGGTVTWNNGKLKWTSRFIAISMGGSSFSAGYVNITMPVGSIPGTNVYDGNARAITPDGVPLLGWEALYAVHDIGRNETAVSFQIVSYTKPFAPPSNWILVAVVNPDEGTIKLGTGQTLSDRSTFTHGNGLPAGAIVLWSGRPDALPVGWALCDGGNGTPNLSGRFVLGSGGGYNPGQVGGEDAHVLTIDEMPTHQHDLVDRGHSHTWSASRQQAGVDDGNNTSELSKGDNGAQDTITKGTTASGANISLNAAGSGKRHNNMPPYFVLAYIMKL